MTCPLCSASIEPTGKRGRPRRYCTSCAPDTAQRKRAYYKAHGDVVRARQRAKYHRDKAAQVER